MALFKLLKSNLIQTWRSLFILISFLSILFPIASSAQLIINWDRSYGGRGDETLVEILRLENGDYLLAGTSTSPVSGTKTAAPKGWMDYYVIRINSQGDILWDKTYGGDRKDELTSVIQTSDGNFILAGHSSSGISGDKSEDSRGDADYWIVKIDPDGNKIWDRTFGGDGDDLLKQVIEAPDGGFVLGGISYSGISGDKSEPQKRIGNGFHGSDNWVLRVNHDGSRIWDRTLGGDEADIFEIMRFENNRISFYSIYKDSYDRPENGTSDITFTSETPSFFGGIWNCILNDDNGEIFSQEHIGIDAYGYLINKIFAIEKDRIRALQTNYNIQEDTDFGVYSPIEINEYPIPFPVEEQIIYNGEQVDGFALDYSEFELPDQRIEVIEFYDPEASWTTDLRIGELILGGDKDEHRPLLSATPPGEILIGSTSFSGQSGSKSALSNGGSDIWLVNVIDLPDYDLSGKDSLTTIINTKEGYILAGSSDSPAQGIKSEGNRGGLDYWIVHMNKAGEVLWERTIGGSEDDILVSGLALDNGNYLFAGYSESNSSGEKSSNRRGSSDLWVVCLDEDGELIWDEIYGERKVEVGGYLGKGTGDFVYLLGSSDSDAYGNLKSQDSFGGFDYWLLALDPENGAKLWDKNYGGSEDEFATDIEVVFRNRTNSEPYPEEVFLGGVSYSKRSGNKNGYRNGRSDLWVVRTNPAGVYRSDQNFGGSKDERNARLAINPDGTYLIAGSSNSPANRWKDDDGPGGFDYWIVKANRFNEVIWEETAGTVQDDQLVDLLVQPDGYTLSGYNDDGTRLIKLNKDKQEIWTQQYDHFYGGYLSPRMQTFLIAGTDDQETLDFGLKEISIPSEMYTNPFKLWDRQVPGEITNFNLRVELHEFNDVNYLISTVDYDDKTDVEIKLEKLDSDGLVVETRQFQLQHDFYEIYEPNFLVDPEDNFFIAFYDFYEGYEIIKYNSSDELEWRHKEYTLPFFNQLIKLDLFGENIMVTTNLTRIFGEGNGQLLELNQFGEKVKTTDLNTNTFFNDIIISDNSFIQMVSTRSRQWFLQRMMYSGEIDWSRQIEREASISLEGERLILSTLERSSKSGSSGDGFLKVFNYNLDGDLLWFRGFPAKGIVTQGSFIRDSKIYVYGTRTPDNSIIIYDYSKGYNDVFISGFDAFGVPEFDYTIGSAGNDQLRGVTFTDESVNFFIASNPNEISYDKTVEGDYWLVRGTLPSAEYMPTALNNISNEIIESRELIAYPNPAENDLWLMNIAVEPEQITIRDLNGRKMNIQVRKEEQKTHIDISRLSAGIYLLTVDLQNESVTHRIIKR